MDKNEIQLYKELIEDKLEIFRLQQGRLVSDWQSEKDNREELKKRVDIAISMINELNIHKNHNYEIVLKHDRILLNGGQGLTFEVDRLKKENESLKRANEEKKNNFQWLIPTIISLISVAVSVFIALFNK